MQPAPPSWRKAVALLSSFDIVRLLAGSVARPLPRHDSAEAKHVFSLVLQAVHRAGGTVELRGICTGQNPNPVVFRGAPGYMSSTAQNFCFARCLLNGKEFEIHVDVIYVGGSGATHEIDVSVYDRSAADVVRQASGLQPSTRALRAAFECKFYDSSLGTALGRAFYGLVADCGTLTAKIFVTNGESSGLARYFSKPSWPQAFFSVSPIIAADADRFVGVVEQALRKWASVA